MQRNRIPETSIIFEKPCSYPRTRLASPPKRTTVAITKAKQINTTSEVTSRMVRAGKYALNKRIMEIRKLLRLIAKSYFWQGREVSSPYVPYRKSECGMISRRLIPEGRVC